MTTRARIYNHIKDKPDTRDFKFSAVVKPVKITLPISVDLRISTKCVPKILDQGSLGSCTANASSNCLRYLLKKQLLKDWQPSRLFIYYYSRLLEHTIKEDSGASIRDVMKAIHTYGACDEKLLPYNIETFAIRPSNKCVRDASPHTKNFKYLSVSNNLTDIKRCVSSGFPVVIGIDIYESFETDEVAKTGIVPMPAELTENYLGGHCVAVFGYSDVKKCFIVMNSWGSTWGDKGFFYLPYEYMLKYGSDLWTISFFD